MFRNVEVSRGRISLAALTMVSCCSVLPAAAWESTIEHGNASAVAVDAVDDVIAAGLLRSSRSPNPEKFDPSAQTFEDLAVTKHSGADGALLWSAVVHGDDDRNYSDDELDTLRTTSGGDVLIGGKMRESTGWGRFAVVALDGADGSEQWRYAQSLHPDFGPGVNDKIGGRVRDVAVDPSGNVLAAGGRRSFYHSVGTEDVHEGMLVKLDGTTGVEIWRRSVFGTVTEAPEAQAGLTRVVVAADGDAIVGGMVENAASGNDCVVARYDSADGSEVWREEFSFAGADGGGENIENLAADPAGNLVARCTQQVLKLDVSDGSLLWQQSLGALGVPAKDLGLTSTGDVIVAGSVMVTLDPVDHDAAVLRLSGADGSEQWRTQVPGLDASVADDLVEQPLAVEVDANASVFLAMSSRSRSTDEDSQVHKLDAVSGAILWSQTLADKEPRRNGQFGYLVSDLAVDSAGDVAFSGGRFPDTYVAGKIDGGDGSFQRPIAGRRFALKTNGSAALRFDSKDPTIAPVVAGTSGDPTLFGATLTIHNPTTLETSTFDLAAANWTRLDSLSGRGSYRYADESQLSGPCVSASLKSGQFSVRCAGAQIDFTLDETSQGSLAAVMSIGSAATRYCALFDGSSIRQDGAGAFSAKNAAAALSCPVVP